MFRLCWLRHMDKCLKETGYAFAFLSFPSVFFSLMKLKGVIWKDFY